jgi:hypothetical protein
MYDIFYKYTHFANFIELRRGNDPRYLIYRISTSPLMFAERNEKPHHIDGAFDFLT